MENEKYTRAEIQITQFETEDIITTSAPVLEDNETESIGLAVLSE